MIWHFQNRRSGLYFKRYPKVEYAFISSQKTKKQVTNILAAFHLRKIPALRKIVFQKYTASDVDLPESLAENFYKNYRYYWTILIASDIVDPYYEWAIPQQTMDAFVAKKYENGIRFKKIDGTYKTLLGSEGTYGIHHFYNVATDRILDDKEDEEYRALYDADPTSIGTNIVPVTNKAYEEEQNLKTRQLTVVNPNNIVQFTESFNKMMKGYVK